MTFAVTRRVSASQDVTRVETAAADPDRVRQAAARIGATTGSEVVVFAVSASEFFYFLDIWRAAHRGGTSSDFPACRRNSASSVPQATVPPRRPASHTQRSLPVWAIGIATVAIARPSDAQVSTTIRTTFQADMGG